MSITRLSRMLVAAVVALAGGVTVSVATAPPAAADGCYTWSSTLREGSSGEDVTRLQIRVAGWVAYGEVLGIDGSVRPGHQAGGDPLPAGVRARRGRHRRPADLQQDLRAAGRRLHADPLQLRRGRLQLRPRRLLRRRGVRRPGAGKPAARHVEGSRRCGTSSATGRSGSSSGFRDYSCNASVGGASNCRHLYGDALDLVPGPSLCSHGPDRPGPPASTASSAPATRTTTTTPTSTAGRGRCWSAPELRDLSRRGGAAPGRTAPRRRATVH